MSTPEEWKRQPEWNAECNAAYEAGREIGANVERKRAQHRLAEMARTWADSTECEGENGCHAKEVAAALVRAAFNLGGASS